MRSLDEAFDDLRSRFDQLAVAADVAAAAGSGSGVGGRERGGEEEGAPGPVITEDRKRQNCNEQDDKENHGEESPAKKVFPLLTKKQSDHFFRKYKKREKAAMRISGSASGGAASAAAALRGSEDLATTAGDRRAAVLVLLCTARGEPAVLLTRRSSQLSSHGGEISFPGGHHDPLADRSMLDTALREAREELAPIRPGMLELCKSHHEESSSSSASNPCLTLLGSATPVPSLKGIPVQPFVGAILGHDFRPGVSRSFPGDPREVDRVFSVSLRHLLRAETTHELPQNRFGTVHAPLFPAPPHVGGDIWGLTAFILRPLLHKLLAPVLVRPGTGAAP
jgi:8-oxo-dGTP pyrophosphatase MutT (NUDIX family)